MKMKIVLNLSMSAIIILGFVFFGRAADALLDRINAALDAHIAAGIVNPLSILIFVTQVLLFAPLFGIMINRWISYSKEKKKDKRMVLCLDR